MKKDELVEVLKRQYKDTNKEIEKFRNEIQARREVLIKIEGALEALSALESEVKPSADHTEAAMALGVFK